MHKNTINLTGSTFGRWTVLAHAGKHRNNQMLWLCRCSCPLAAEKKLCGSVLRMGISRSCGCLMKEQASARMKKKLIKPTVPGLHSIPIARYKIGAKHRGIEWHLSDNQALSLMARPCFYCGKPDSMTTRRPKAKNNLVFKHNGIDRFDNSKGYTLENSVPCCSLCNGFKWAHSADDFYSQIIRIYEHNYSSRKAA